MNREELKKLIRGVSTAVPTPFDDDMRLDLATATELTKWWVENGLGTDTAPIKLAAAWGQGPDLSDDEWPHLLRTVVNAAGSGAVVMQALKSKDTMHAIEDAKKAHDLGAIGLQIDLPYHHGPNQDTYVRYFTDIPDAIDIGIMIYNTYWYGCPPITAETLLRLADAEHVVAVKWNAPEDGDYDEMRQFSHIFNVIDNGGGPVRCHKNGGRGFVSAYAPAYAAHDLEVWRLLEEGRYEEAQAKEDLVNNAIGPVGAKIAQRSGGYKLAKGMMQIVGHSSGPPRQPTLPLNDEELAELREAMQSIGWVVPEAQAALA